MTAWRRVLIVTAALSGPAFALSAQQASRQRFDHSQHRRLFPTCVACHQAPASGEGPLYPDTAACAGCHDGSLQPRVAWQPPEGPRRTNLRFDHALIPIMTPPGHPEPPTCTVCHAEADAPWMAVERVSFGRCLNCHGVHTVHLAAPDTACSVCHLALPEAKDLTREDIAAFPTPPSHRDPGWARGAGHGRAAQSGGRGARVAASCATCHARDFCLTCHTDASKPPAIQALALDSRSTAIVAHGRPPFHGDDFARGHGAMAARTPARCASCHVQADCLECHRPNAGAGGAGRGYHPAGFLARHPAAAYARETSCSDCHNPGAFCAACHTRAGLSAGGPLRPGYHDSNQFFITGHGQAARQSLETCVSCHAERDCLTCHSALGGRRFNPHGAGFDAERLRRKNPQMCTVCHGTAIPTP